MRVLRGYAATVVCTSGPPMLKSEAAPRRIEAHAIFAHPRPAQSIQLIEVVEHGIVVTSPAKAHRSAKRRPLGQSPQHVRSRNDPVFEVLAHSRCAGLTDRLRHCRAARARELDASSSIQSITFHYFDAGPAARDRLLAGFLGAFWWIHFQYFCSKLSRLQEPFESPVYHRRIMEDGGQIHAMTMLEAVPPRPGLVPGRSCRVPRPRLHGERDLDAGGQRLKPSQRQERTAARASSATRPRPCSSRSTRPRSQPRRGGVVNAADRERIIELCSKTRRRSCRAISRATGYSRLDDPQVRA